MVADAFNLNSQETEAIGFLWVQGQCGLHSELQDSQSYVETPYLKKYHPHQKKIYNLSLIPQNRKPNTYVLIYLYLYLYIYTDR